MTKILPHASLAYIQPDEIAECWDGVFNSGDLYEKLWDCVPLYDNKYRENIEDIGPHDVIGINSTTKFWDRFSDEHKAKLNELAAANDPE